MGGGGCETETRNEFFLGLGVTSYGSITPSAATALNLNGKEALPHLDMSTLYRAASGGRAGGRVGEPIGLG